MKIKAFIFFKSLSNKVVMKPLQSNEMDNVGRENENVSSRCL